MLLHGDIEYRLAKLHIEDLHNEAHRLRRLAEVRTSSVQQESDPGQALPGFQIWRIWRVKRRPAAGAA